jgi:hypothetical protein
MLTMDGVAADKFKNLAVLFTCRTESSSSCGYVVKQILNLLVSAWMEARGHLTAICVPCLPAVGFGSAL